MIKIKNIFFVIFLFYLCLPIYAQESEPNWINKKLLKLENFSDVETNKSEINNNRIVSPIDLNDLVEENIILPYYYWSWSNIDDLTRKINGMPSRSKPPIKELIIAVLTSEMPVNLDISSEAILYISRLNKLLDLGQYKDAQIFINNNDPGLSLSSNQQFILNILRGNETLACSQFKIGKISKISLKQKLYCLNYEGKTSEAKIIFETSKIFNKIDNHDKLIINILLKLSDDIKAIPNNIDTEVSALDYVILQKNRIKVPEKYIPKSLLLYDLSQTFNLEKKIYAAEELAKIGAIQNKQLFNVYREENIISNATLNMRRNNIVELEASFITKDSKLIQQNLIKCLNIFEKIGLGEQFSETYKEEVLNQVSTGWETPTSVKMRLLTRNYTELDGELSSTSNFISAQSIARNDFTKLKSLSALEEILIDAFRNPIYNPQNTTLIEQGKIGEVIISSILLLHTQNVHDMQKGLIGLIQAGLEDTAKHIAISYLLAG